MKFRGNPDRGADSRVLFRQICNGRHPHVATTFRIGDFFGRHVPWMSPLLALYANDQLEAYAALLEGAAPFLTVDLCESLIVDIAAATREHDFDIELFMKPSGNWRQNEAWAKFLKDCRSERIPDLTGSRQVATVQHFDDLMDRQRARRRCVMTREQQRKLKAIFDGYSPSGRDAGISAARKAARSSHPIGKKRNLVAEELSYALLPRRTNAYHPFWGGPVG